jgi:MFS superfamily sulfate permease-like transporter
VRPSDFVCLLVVVVVVVVVVLFLGVVQSA